MNHIETSLCTTNAGTHYFQAPGVSVLAKTESCLSNMQPFLETFVDDPEFLDYLDDRRVPQQGWALGYQQNEGGQLAKMAGQLCYLSFGERRRKNDQMQAYMDNIIESGHGSVIEHASYTLLFYGVDRAFTHELVRHRVSFSQVSQRYVNKPRFVERVMFCEDPILHKLFIRRIDDAMATYEHLAERITNTMQSDTAFLAMEPTDRRKYVNQAARACLPNETEAPIIMTGNLRWWRHIIEQRCSPHADVAIRVAMFGAFQILQAHEPIIFNDYEIMEVPDGTQAVTTKNRKV